MTFKTVTFFGCRSEDREAGWSEGKAFPFIIIEDLDFTLIGTQGTADFYNANGIKCEVVNKIGGGRPDVVDLIMNKEVCLVINTPKAKRNYAEDRKTIRKVCLKYKVSYITTLAGAVAAVKGIEAVKNGNGGEGGVKSLQEYHALIK